MAATHTGFVLELAARAARTPWLAGPVPCVPHVLVTGHVPNVAVREAVA